MLKLLKLFLIFSFLPSVSFAWNSMCYSPVQLSALLSKPKKSSGAVSQSSLRKIQSGIDKLEKELDKEEGNLQDSLDKDKLKARPSSVASKIRSYIEDEQDGWDCPKNQISLFLFPSLIPQAYAEEDPGYSDSDTLNKSADGFFDSEEKATASKSNQTNRGVSGSSKLPTGKANGKGSNNPVPGKKPAPQPVSKAPVLGKKPASQPVSKAPVSGKKPAPQPVSKAPVSGKKPAPQPVSKAPVQGKKTAEQVCKEKASQGYEWKGGKCVKTAEQVCKEKASQGYEWKGGKCVKTAEQVCKEKASQGYEWKGGKCVKTAEQVCKEKASQGYEWKGGKCVKTAEQVCKEKAFQGYEWKGGKCVKTAEQECLDRPGEWELHNNKKCVCPPKSHIQEGKNCRKRTRGDDCKDKGAPWTWHNGKCSECPDWKKHPAFKSNGKVSSSFCDEYAKDRSDCKRALSNLQRRAKQLQRLKDQLRRLEEQLLRADSDSKDESETEASGLCFDCLKRVIKASQPSTGQVIGNSLSLLAGAGMSFAGYHIGRSAQKQANILRIQQGYPSQYDAFNLTGLGAGFPFMANGLYGMTRTNTPVGGWSCSPSVSPYGHAYNYGYGYGHNMRYY